MRFARRRRGGIGLLLLLGIVLAGNAADVAALGVDGAPALTGDAPRTACRTRTDCVYRFNTFDAEPRMIASRSRSVYRIRLGLRFEF